MRFHYLASMILLTAAAAQADTVTMYFTALPSTNMNGTYNGYSTVTINGIPSESVICDDFNHDTTMPSSAALTYDYSTLSGAHPLQYARFTGTNETKNYEEAAVLLVGLSTDLASGHATATDVTNYQYAIWNLFTPYSVANPNGAKANSDQQALQSAALTIVNAGGQTAANDYKQLVIYTPTVPYAGNQEFLGLNTTGPSPAPEPGTATLLAVALGAAFWTIRRRKLV